MDADRDITSPHIRCLQSSCKAAIPASLNGAIKNKWELLEKLPLQRGLITLTPVCSRKKREGGGGWKINKVACPNWSDSKPEQTPTGLLTAKSLDSEIEHH